MLAPSLLRGYKMNLTLKGISDLYTGTSFNVTLKITDKYAVYNDVEPFYDVPIKIKTPLGTTWEYYTREDNSGAEYEVIHCYSGEWDWDNSYNGAKVFGGLDIQTWDRKEIFIRAKYLARPWPRAEKKMSLHTIIIELDSNSQTKLHEWLNTYQK